MDRFQRRLNGYEQRVGGPAAPEGARAIGSDILPVWLLGEDRTDVERVLSFAVFEGTAAAGNAPRGILKARSAPLWVEKFAVSQPGASVNLAAYFEDDDGLGTPTLNITTSDGSDSPAVVTFVGGALPSGVPGLEQLADVSLVFDLGGFVLPAGRQLVVEGVSALGASLRGMFVFRPMEREA